MSSYWMRLRNAWQNIRLEAYTIKTYPRKARELWVDRWYNMSFRLRAAITGDRLVYVIGDSHSLIFKRTWPFIVYHVGPATAYNLGSNTSTTNSGKKLTTIIDKIDKRKVIIIFSFGEVDCRNHIWNKYKKLHEKILISELIDITINRYIYVLLSVKQQGFDLAVLGIPAANNEPNIHHFEYATPSDARAAIYRDFNSKMRHHCQINGILYIDVYSVTSNADGFINDSYTDDGIHCNRKILGIVSDCVRAGRTLYAQSQCA